MAASLLETLGRVGVAVLYLAAFGLAFGEAAFLLDLLVPGEVGLIVVGAAGREHGATLPVLIALGALGAFAGDSMSWWIGHRWGTSLVQRWHLTRRFVAPGLGRAKAVLDRRGGPAVFGARWVGALRAVVPMVAGAAEMPYRRFAAWDAPAALGWSAVAVSLGWFLGEHVASAVDRWGGYLSVLVLAALLGWWLVRHRRARTGARGGG